MNILDLDHSLTGQASIARLLDSGRARRLDLLDLGPKLRLWSSERTFRRFAERLRERPRHNGPAPEIFFVGSGDYHHLTPAFLTDLPEPVSLIHFDNHPDWVHFAPRRHCGSWVNQALKLPNIERIVTLGPCSDDLQNPQIKGGNLGALKRGVLQLFPWQHPPSKVWGRVGDGAGHQQQENLLHWNNLADQDWTAFLDRMIASLPTQAVWITIDKDVLASEDAATNWDQGQMRLSHLLQAIRSLAASKRVIGIDICGEFARPAFSNAFKRWEAKSDQPPAERWSETDLLRNSATNQALIELFEELFP
ncbi:arginase [Pseudomonas kribbensis]|uniref:Arginase n=1 Tax=Pseudomonas kribbensis TaxID=1628086 RepID=A0A345RVA6_9PSED|nr:arginase [Pseudomonas kribbensis]AXI63222.1 arginase [Pseudomonas kribbensis]